MAKTKKKIKREEKRTDRKELNRLMKQYENKDFRNE